MPSAFFREMWVAPFACLLYRLQPVQVGAAEHIALAQHLADAFALRQALHPPHRASAVGGSLVNVK